MKITSEQPENWIELQNLVSKYLNDAGYSAVSPKTIQTVRGKVQVDVFASANTELIQQFICECKCWSTPVSKEKVHAFRTVVNDSGSTLGILISKSGYQSGAIEAAHCSNVLLKDWDGFIALITNKWLFNKLIKLKRIAFPLSIYTDSLDIPWEKLNDKEREIYNKLSSQFMQEYLFGFSLDLKVLQKEFVVIGNQRFEACNDLLDYLEKRYITAIKGYEDIFVNHKIDSYKFERGGYMLSELTDDLFNGWTGDDNI